MMTRGDFHIHSTASDGSLSPLEIVIYAKELGIDTIALADHNTTAGIGEAAAAGRQYGVAVVPAVELSTRYKGESIHILGYFRSNAFYNGTFQSVLRMVRTHRCREARRVLSSFLYTDNTGDYLSTYEGISLLRAFGAAVVLAHPVRISSRHLPELLNMPFDGIEAKYSHSSYYATSYFINQALSRFSFYTGGSDFHGQRSFHNTHSSLGEFWLNPMEIQMFLRNSGAVVLF